MFQKPLFVSKIGRVVGWSLANRVDRGLYYITNPRSAPLELEATVPEYMMPFVPILERGEEPFATFKDLWIKHRQWVLNPIRYPSVDRLIEVLDTKIIKPAQVRFAELLAL